MDCTNASSPNIVQAMPTYASSITKQPISQPMGAYTHNPKPHAPSPQKYSTHNSSSSHTTKPICSTPPPMSITSPVHEHPVILSTQELSAIIPSPYASSSFVRSPLKTPLQTLYYFPKRRR
ncbi:hypothetical protein LIER_33658 [Lithospermum erythrorhizon]|uniref:Uncharacterized protein n=1 Tax=Lithospermum erythrorhizon TaxID=34254 RepID=A0AAV3RZU5_LITER